MTDNLVLNSPFEEPSRFFQIVDGQPQELVAGHRPSDNVMPVPLPKKRGPGQASFIDDRIEDNEYINPDAWETLYRTESVPFDKPATGKIAVKVINHYGDEVLQVYEVG
ncbi:MAG: hypothetical protein R3264_05190 [Anaerolineae bacterium]|nr:hypothetical protein [Anaerolineae bacterium]